jgi:Bacteriophage head to tail connecting protein
MADTRENMLCDELGALKAQRVNFNTTWDRISRVVLPTMTHGFTTTQTPGMNLNRDIFDSTAQMALPRFAAAIDTLVTPQTSRWHQLTPKTARLKRDTGVTTFLHDLNELLFKVRYSPRANFTSRANENYMSLGAFGTGITYVHDAMPGIRYRSMNLAETWIDTDANGTVNRVFNEREYKLHQIVEHKVWGPKVPASLKGDYEKNRHKPIKVCMAVYPRESYNPRGKSNLDMPYASVVFISSQRGEDRVVLEESGYRKFPFGISRYMTAPNEVYARGPAHDALADILTLQAMARTTLRYGELVTDPVWLLADEDAMDPFAARAGAMNYGYLSPEGTPRVQALRPDGNPGFGLEIMDQRRQAVNGAFLVTLFQVLVENTSDRKTATEVMELVREKGALLGPVGGRLRTEYLGPMIERELDILFAAKVIRPEDVPRALLEDGANIDIEYDSPLTRAMRAEEGIGILRTLETATQLAGIDPTVTKKINVARALDRLAEINGAPPDILFSDEEMSAKVEAEQQQMALAQGLQAAPGLATAAKDLAAAQEMSAPRSV